MSFVLWVLLGVGRDGDILFITRVRFGKKIVNSRPDGEGSLESTLRFFQVARRKQRYNNYRMRFCAAMYVPFLVPELCASGK